MSPCARYAATALGLAGIGVCIFFLFYAMPIAADWVAYLFGSTPAKPHLQGLATFVGVAASLGTVVLLVGIGLILWIFKQLWLPGRRGRE